MDLGLDGHVFLVTGGTRGLGRATAEALVAEGARVVVSSRNPDSVASAVEALGAEHAEGVVADNAAQDTADRLVTAARDRWGRVDGALLSVGGPPGGKAHEMTDDQWRGAFESVFLGGVRLARGIAAELGEGGSLALVLSTSVKSPVPGLGISNGLRPGLAMVAKEMADEFGPRGIRVNSLLPGRIDTDRVQELDALTGDAEAARATVTSTIPLRRYGRPEEFGAVAAFILSPKASFITGVALPVDGGALRV